MTERAGRVKWSLILILGTALLLLCIVVGAWYSMREMNNRNARRFEEVQKESQKKMREKQAESAKQVIAVLKKGGAFVSGIRFSANGVIDSMSVSGVPKGEVTTCSIPWPVPQADLATIQEGTSLEEVRRNLDLTTLHYVPDGPKSRFILHCNWQNRRVTLVFAGEPEVKLIKKSVEEAD